MKPPAAEGVNATVSVPLKYHHDTLLNYGDDIEHFQFSIGQAF